MSAGAKYVGLFNIVMMCTFDIRSKVSHVIDIDTGFFRISKNFANLASLAPSPGSFESFFYDVFEY